MGDGMLTARELYLLIDAVAVSKDHYNSLVTDVGLVWEDLYKEHEKLLQKLKKMEEQC